MKLGYPCINRSIGCVANSTFRLSNYSEPNMIAKISNNLDCLERILSYNSGKGLFFFRITSDLVPFASHPVCNFDWQNHFRQKFEEIGRYIRSKGIRISMHPDQFVLINSPKKEITERSIRELAWHCEAMDLMGLDSTAKVQIHIGGAYGDRKKSLSRFADNYQALPRVVRDRLAIENDDRIYSIDDCMAVHDMTGIPVIFDSFHHECLNDGKTREDAISMAEKTWSSKDGILMTDYSSQQPGARKGKHAQHIDIGHFKRYLEETKGHDLDIMLEIKDKEKSAIEARKVI